MAKILIIGAGAAGSVTVKKCDKNRDVFSNIHLASRTLAKCQTLQSECNGPIDISQIDADKTNDLITLMQTINPDLAINMALPYQDLSIMDACLKTNTHYLDTANYEPKDKAKFCYKWQWDYHKKFKENNLLAVLGCGFDPGVTNGFCAYAQKHLFDEIHHIDIVDCNAGNHGHPFATNFNPEINIREITQPGRYWENGNWIQVDPMSVSEEIEFPEIGNRKAYLLYHEELESLVKFIPKLKRIRFWMTFSDDYLTHLRVLENVGMTRIDPIEYNGQNIVPLQFLKSVLPDPGKLGENYSGKTCIGVILEGIKDNTPKKVMIYNVCNHEASYKEVRAQAVSYTTGVPAMIGAKLICNGIWSGQGVFNIEQLDPDPFMDELNKHGLPWKIINLS